MSSNKIIPLKMGHQPFFWRQAVSDSPHRGWSLRNILLYPLIKLKYKFKNHDSFLCDVLIIGSNPILNILLLKKLAQKERKTKTPLRVAILKVSDADYWAYHEVQKTEFLKSLSKHFDFEINDIKHLMSQIVKNTNWSNIEPVFMSHDNLSVQYIKKDKHINGFIAHISKKEKENNIFFSDKLPTVNAQENKLKEKIWDNFVKLFADFVTSYKEIQWENPIHNVQDNLEKSHILLAKNILLTSLPQGWLNIETQLMDNYTFFKHDFTMQSFGSAARVANNFNMLESQVMEDIKKIEKLILNNENLAYS